MITAKAVREKAQSAHSQPTRDDYVQAEPQSKKFLPLVFLAIVTGCAAYLRSFLPIQSAPSAATPAEARYPHSDRDQPQGDSPAPELTAEIDAELDPEPHPRVGSHDNVVPIRLFAESGGMPIIAPGSIRPATAAGAPASIAPASPAPRDPGSFSRAIPEAGGSNGSGGGGGGGSGGRDREPETAIRNRAPRVNGPVHLQDLVGCQVTLAITALTLLAGATDADGDRLRITSVSASSGTLVPTADGWIFQPTAGMRGDITLTYTISDGQASVVQTAYFSVKDAPPVIGTDDADTLLGTQCGETIEGRAGDDNIDARGGNDIIIGGAGNDHIIGGAGNDIVHAGDGDDVVFAGAGHDIVFGGAGNDRLHGDDGNDVLMGEDGDDVITGGNGSDILVGGAGHDHLKGDAGNDTLDGGEGDDRLEGSDGNDVLIGGAGQDRLLGGGGNDVLDGEAGNDVLSDGEGSDTVSGGSGDDVVEAATDAADDTYDGGIGQDRLDYSRATASMTIDLRQGTADGLEIGHDLISAFEEIVCGSGNDHLIGGSNLATMTGGDGDDTFEFRSDNGRDQAMTVGKITDFRVGDRIVASTKYLIDRSDEADDEAEPERFEQVYSGDGDNRPVRFRFKEKEAGDDTEVTFIDVYDGSDQGADHYTIEVFGHQHLRYTFTGA